MGGAREGTGGEELARFRNYSGAQSRAGHVPIVNNGEIDLTDMPNRGRSKSSVKGV